MTMSRAIPAPPPFDHSEADVILRSSDKEPLDFRVFKLLLSLSSPFFTEIFTLPQPATPSPENTSSPYADEYSSFDPVTLKHRRIPIIQMAEDQETLSYLLGLCLPISIAPQPHFSSLETLLKVAEAAIKFEMTGIQAHLRAELISPRFIEAQPLRVFAIAYRYAWDAEARKAARYTLRQPLNSSFVNELSYISAATFFKLQEYHRTCGEVASSRALLQPALAEKDDNWAWVACKRCPGPLTKPIGFVGGPSNATSTFTNTPPSSPIALAARFTFMALGIQSPSTQPETRGWWVEWLQELAKELEVKPWGETVRKWDPMNRAIEKAAACTFCGPRAKKDLDWYAQILSAEIEKDISSVRLDISFGDDWASSSPSNA
ncbi:hypothetical protein CPB83DRAFT_790789 [Crepidotus variabilis]|uniref:BTB domain-containing protein n=1 Tax=Crepidotus variabilis TaxID=179855 RepID=A0A9P6JQJ7_9AGAR|nr:hypothetical protein CPB83DRAFT_790789 [Crepidotus variabilis]